MMKKIIAAAFLAVVLHTAATAQDRPRRTPEERAKNQVEMLKPLQLSTEQEQKIYTFNLQLQAGDPQNKEGDRQSMMGRGQEIRAQRDAAYKQILNADQYSRYQAMQAERREKFRQRMSENGDANMPKQDN